MSDILNEFYLTFLACITSNFQDSCFFRIIQLWDTICNIPLPGNFIFRVLSKNTYGSVLMSVFYVDLVFSWSITQDCPCYHR